MSEAKADALESLGERILNQLKALFGSEWDRLGDKERKLLTDATADAAFLTMAALGGENVEVERLQIDAQIANLRSATAAKAHRLFWKAVDIILSTSIAALRVA